MEQEDADLIVALSIGLIILFDVFAIIFLVWRTT